MRHKGRKRKSFTTITRNFGSKRVTGKSGNKISKASNKSTATVPKPGNVEVEYVVGSDLLEPHKAVTIKHKC